MVELLVSVVIIGTMYAIAMILNTHDREIMELQSRVDDLEETGIPEQGTESREEAPRDDRI